jgi:U4/U6 small nuclear ribonucleoprotein PRP3
VNKEITERREDHEAMNENRKLTKEQRREKLANQQETDAQLGIYVSVYRIDNLASGRNRFKINKNAEQNLLTGVCVTHPKVNLVIVEGGKHSINNYRKLMLNRIDWSDNPGPTTSEKTEGQPIWWSTEDDKGEPRDFRDNTCTLLWEGQAKTRVFRKWLGARPCESDSAAKEVLARAKMENFWALAKSAKPAEF